MLYRHEDDETLVMLTLAGDETAYEGLVLRHQKAVIASALSVTHNRFLAEDAAQDAFVAAWMKLNTLQDRAKYGAWTCKIAKNCARNLIMRYRQWIPLSEVENLYSDTDAASNPAELYAATEEKDELQKSIRKLPEKVGRIIHLHYFEELSVSEIAEKMSISEGTVKWQLHEGRKRIRKELCAMNEQENDTLLQRVMKKVEELKLWQFKNDKSGVAMLYRDVLTEVEALPESGGKYHALADVLMRGFWWLPGEKNDALFARIRDAAEKGKNEDAMSFIVERECSDFYDDAQLFYIRDKQIPRLTEAGFVHTLGLAWFRLAQLYFDKGQTQECEEAYAKVCEILPLSDPIRILVPYAKTMDQKIKEVYKDTPKSRYGIGICADEFRYADGSLRYWTSECYRKDRMHTTSLGLTQPLRIACFCDGMLFADTAPGVPFIGSDGTTLTLLDKNVCVQTPAGKFENCVLWETRHFTSYDKSLSITKAYYQDGVGLVKIEYLKGGISEIYLLRSYHIAGGTGLFPIAEGNRWDYISDKAPDTMRAEYSFAVAFHDQTRTIIASLYEIEQLRYDEDSWLDMIMQIRNEYCDRENHLCDVSHAVSRAEALAKTPLQKAHTKAAVSVLRRIMETNSTLNSDRTIEGYWNFFARHDTLNTNGTIILSHDYRWSFEWKGWDGSIMGTAILFNDVYGILQDATDCVWSDGWRIGAALTAESSKWGCDVKTALFCEHAGTVTVKAGTFENCLRLSLDIAGMTDGLSYRGGKKVYTFAEGIGIIRTENEIDDGIYTAVYELTAYEGTGEGFFPIQDGMMRCYEAQGLTDGFVSSVLYTYAADENGDVKILGDRTGIRVPASQITRYSTIYGETLEHKLWEKNDWQGTHLRHAINDFHILLHYISRNSYNRMNAFRSIGMAKIKLNLMESLGDGEVPAAWDGLYAWIALTCSAACFGYREKDMKEDGYRYLESAFAHIEKDLAVADGTPLAVGNFAAFRGIRLLKGKRALLLPDGTKEPCNGDVTTWDKGVLYHILNNSQGWSWFNSARKEERFQAYIERARRLAETEE